MNKLFCLFRNSDFSRFVFDQEQGGESFAEEAKRKAKEFNEDVGEKVDSAGNAIAGGAKALGEAVVGTVKEMPGVVADAHEATVDAAANVIESAVGGVTKLRADMVEKMANTFASVDEKLSGAKKAAWEEVKPVVAVLVGTGYLALDKVEKIAGEAKDFSVAKLNAAIDWGKVAKDYVKDGAVNFAIASKELGEDTANYIVNIHEGMVSGTADGIAIAIGSAKMAGRAVVEFNEEGTDRIARVMVAIDNAATGATKKAWIKIRPTVALLYGEGYLAAEKITEMGSDAKKFTIAKLEKAVDLGKFVANYVKDGVVDKAKVVAELGKDAGTFVAGVWDKAVEKTKMGVNEAVGLAVAAGKDVEELREDVVDQVATAILTIDSTATGAAKVSWEAVRPVAVVLWGEGYLAVDKATEWAGDAKNWSADKLYAALDYGKFAVDYVKNGVVDMKRVAEDFGEDVAEKVAQVYKETAERVGKHIELAQAEGYRILGEGLKHVPPAPVESMWAKVWPKGKGNQAEVIKKEAVAGTAKFAKKFFEGKTVAAASEAKKDEGIINHEVSKGENMIKILKQFYPADQVNVSLAREIQKQSLGKVATLKSGIESLIKPGDTIKLPKTVTYMKNGRTVTVERNS